MKPTEFFERLPDGRYKFRIDHHLISDHNTCDRFFQFRHMPADPSGQVWSTKFLNINIAIGGWWASVMESYYNEMKQGHFPSIDNVRTFAREAWKFHEMERYKNDPSSMKDYDKFGGEEGGAEMAMSYHLSFGLQHFKNWKILGTEEGFGWSEDFLLGEDDRVVVYYGGKPDQTILDLSQNMIMPKDDKSRKTVPGDAASLFKPHPQTAGYIYCIGKMLRDATERGTLQPELRNTLPPTKCIIMVAARFRPTEKPRNGVAKPRFVPVHVNYSLAELEEWRQSVVWKCRLLRDEIEQSYFPPREAACHVYSGGCIFRRVCSAPPNMRQQVLAADFVRQDPWVPYSIED